MMGNGITAMLVGKELSIILIVMFIMGNGLTINVMDMASTSIIRMQNIKVTGKTTASMDMELSHGQMALISRGTTKRESNLGKGSTFGLITQNIKGSGKIIR
jgi:hypothetical protein